jgi:hypothetical protein
MLGNLLRKLMGGQEKGIQQVSPRDASQIPAGMNTQRQPLNVPQLPRDASQMPQGMQMQEAPQLQMAQPRPYGQQSIGQVRQPHPGMQPFMPAQEDDFRPGDMLNNSNNPFPYSPQETQYGYKQQGSSSPNLQGDFSNELRRRLGL